MGYELWAAIGIVCGLVGGTLLGAWLAGDFEKTYSADFIPGPKFRSGLSKNPEE